MSLAIRLLSLNLSGGYLQHPSIKQEKTIIFQYWKVIRAQEH